MPGVPAPSVLSIVGLCLVLALAGVSLFWPGAAPDGTRFAGTVLVAAVGWVAGSVLGGFAPWVPGVTVALGVSGAFVVRLPESLSGDATAPPLSYANANGALLVASVAGLVAAWLATSTRQATAFLPAAGVLAVGAVLTGSQAAGVSSVMLLMIAPLLRHGSARAWQVAGGLLILAAFAATVVIGAAHARGEPVGLVADTVSTIRAALWSDALHLASGEPLLGVGPGNFARFSPTAGADPDLARPHSAPLGVLAELGVLGFASMGALTLWVVIRLRRAAIVFAVLALQPMVDYVLDYRTVVAASAVVLGGLAAGPTSAHGAPPATPHAQRLRE